MGLTSLIMWVLIDPVIGQLQQKCNIVLLLETRACASRFHRNADMVEFHI